MDLGAQLYTVREYTQTLDALSLTLRKIADIGYTTVQVSNTCDYEPQWLAEQLHSCGLHGVMVDYGLPLLPDCEYVMLTLMPGEIDDYAKFREEFTVVSEGLANTGRKLLYHNHVTEFAKSDCG
ncbi:MAG: hypothetical protein FWG45_04085, partial [Oscillospiraceae bacterium]|nr:hypothetical protein [Oscillospiraceae bacterium]